jgi:hypothetical protein
MDDSTAYLVVTGAYDEYTVVRAFAEEQAADAWALDYNATHPWTHENDRARVEPVPFTPAS